MDPHARTVAAIEQTIGSGQWEDEWRWTVVPPPIRRCRSVFAATLAGLALAEAGRLAGPVRDALLAAVADAEVGLHHGYARGAPPDADDTAFALRLRSAAGASAEPEPALAPFRTPAGYRTFLVPTGALRWTTVHEVDDDVMGLHPEVDLNVRVALAACGRDPGAAIDRPLGSYHYGSRWYAPSLLAELGHAGPELDRAIAEAQRPDGSWAGMDGGFGEVEETALALCALSPEARATDAARRGRQALVDRQRPDGGFRSGVVWRFSLPAGMGGGRWVAVDPSGLVATALAARALGRIPG